VKLTLVRMMARVMITQQTAIVAYVGQDTQEHSVISLWASVQARLAEMVVPASQEGKALSLAHVQRESRDVLVSRTLGLARPIRARSTPTVRIWVVTTSATALLGYLVRTAMKATTVTVSHARTVAHAR